MPVVFNFGFCLVVSLGGEGGLSADMFSFNL